MKLTLNRICEELEKISFCIGKYCESSQLAKMGAAYLEKLSWVPEEIFVKACRQWDKEKFPTAMQLLHECREIQKQRQDKYPHGIAAINLVCSATQYFSIKKFEQAPEEALKCEFPEWRRVDEHFDRLHNGAEEMHRFYDDSIKTFGLVLCPWHQMLAKAKHHPGGYESDWCSRILEFDRQTKNMSRDEVIEKIKTDLKGNLFKKI